VRRLGNILDPVQSSAQGGEDSILATLVGCVRYDFSSGGWPWGAKVLVDIEQGLERWHDLEQQRGRFVEAGNVVVALQVRHSIHLDRPRGRVLTTRDGNRHLEPVLEEMSGTRNRRK
jgi:hypothetical protein